MKFLADHLNWREMTLPAQFVLAGAVVMLLAMALVGNWVAKRIEAAVVQNSATTAALFVESIISPLSQELAETDTLSPPARQALTEVFENTSLGARIVSFKIWSLEGRVIHSSNRELIGQKFAIGDDLKRAITGEVASSFESLDDQENMAEAELQIPLLEVYSPLREAWSGRVIAVAEFYEHAEDLAEDLTNARRTTWLVVGSAFLASGLLLLGIVQAGGRTIRQQRQHLRNQLVETERVSRQNAELRKRSVAASSRALAQTERAVRRIGSDLHDGPAQYLSLASLRLESAIEGAQGNEKDIGQVRQSLGKALEEIRIISRGLALPDLDRLSIAELAERAVHDHSKQTGLTVNLYISDMAGEPFNYAQKLCVFRFLQETLSNVSRHARCTEAIVTITLADDELTIVVRDAGSGFDLKAPRTVREDGGQGLLGLHDRAESIGGRIKIDASPGKGTRITLILPQETDQ